MIVGAGQAWAEDGVKYIDENGTEQTCTEYTVLDGTETTLGKTGEDIWYVSNTAATENDGKGLVYTGEQIFSGTHVHLILADGTTFEMPVFDSFKKVRDRVQSIVYVPDYFDGQIGVRNDEEQTIRYQVKPAVVATYLADNREAMMLVGEEVKTTRADGAGIAITGASATRSGALILSVKPTGFEAQQGYAFALDIEADGSSYRTAYTPTFLIVEAEKIATVSPSGIVAVVDNAPDGEFTITATTTNGKKASLTFKIVNGMLTIDTEQFHQQEEVQ